MNRDRTESLAPLSAALLSSSFKTFNIQKAFDQNSLIKSFYTRQCLVDTSKNFEQFKNPKVLGVLDSQIIADSIPIL